MFPQAREFEQQNNEQAKDKCIVKAFKLMTKEVEDRNPVIKNQLTRLVVCDPPILYPFITQQLDEKVRLRGMHNNLEMNKYLAESDSDLEDFKSVASHNLPKYIDTYEKKHRVNTETMGQKTERPKFRIQNKGTNAIPSWRGSTSGLSSVKGSSHKTAFKHFGKATFMRS